MSKAIIFDKPLSAYRAALYTSVLALSACGGGGGGGTAGGSKGVDGTLTFAGSAATGAGIVNAPISVKCTGGVQGNTTTSALATYEIAMPAGSRLPCVVRVNGPAGALHAAVGTGFTGGKSTSRL